MTVTSCNYSKRYLGAAESLTHRLAIARLVPALLGEAKVGHLGDIVVQQDVVNLDVSGEEKVEKGQLRMT